jgi:hypothetical protein
MTTTFVRTVPPGIAVYRTPHGLAYQSVGAGRLWHYRPDLCAQDRFAFVQAVLDFDASFCRASSRDWLTLTLDGRSQSFTFDERLTLSQLRTSFHNKLQTLLGSMEHV